MKKFKPILYGLGILMILALLSSLQNISDYIKYKIFFANNLIISISKVNPNVNSISCDNQNQLVLVAKVRDINGKPCPDIPLRFFVSPGVGNVLPAQSRTDSTGDAIIKYIPPEQLNTSKQAETTVNITASIHDTGVNSMTKVRLIRPPVVLLHGYQEHPDIFEGMKEFLIKRKFECMVPGYKSELGVENGAKELDSYLNKQKQIYLANGIQINKFDIIAHSMGGLVARYYTCALSYIGKDDINKIIFVSVPHKGSYWASLGSNLYNDQGIRDLTPDNPLLSKILPSLLNNGLNRFIQTGSILGQYDEVVTAESASLDEWNIGTEIFNVGENNLTIENFLNGSILDAANHKNVLFNNKVFEKIEDMLDRKLQLPESKTN
ncbi:MAG TPA: alpha/beta hydrolase [Pseudobacteroides sp.]|uniref:PGAP1-like alpha/beta domain-containing protein n=1 Tax=Pseudobacteroides sp. TaxID=1968840 RepID=UPI002F92BF68